MQDDKTLSIRVPFDLAQRLEATLHKLRAGRSPTKSNGDAHQINSISDLVRESMKLGLALHERDEFEMGEWAQELFGLQVQCALAEGYRDPTTYKLLKKCAATAPKPDPDFG